MSKCLHEGFYNYEDQGFVCTGCGICMKDAVSDLRYKLLTVQDREIRIVELETTIRTWAANPTTKNEFALKDLVDVR